MAKGRVSVGKTTVAYELLYSLWYLQACWKQDLARVLVVRGSESTAVSSAIRTLVRQGYAEVHASNEKDRYRCYDVLVITDRGRLFVADAEPDSYCSDHYRDYAKRFDSVLKKIGKENLKKYEDEQLFRQMMYSRVKCMFDGAGVAVYPGDKPSLYRLAMLLDEHSTARYSTRQANDPYYLNMSKEECEKMLKEGNAEEFTGGGVFYTAAEYNRFIRQLGHNADQTYGSRALGFYISRNSIMAVYCQKSGSQNMIGIQTGTEDNMIKNVTSHLSHLVPDFGRSITYAGIPSAEMDAIVIANGNAMIYSMTTGFRNGLLKDINTRGQVGAKRVLCYATNMFTNVYVIPQTAPGVRSLTTLTHTSIERRLANFRTDVSKLGPDYVALPVGECDSMVQGLKVEEYVNEKGVQKRRTRKIVPLPVPEVHTLRSLSADNYDEDGSVFCVIAPAGMEDAISHAVRREIEYVDSETLKFVMRDERTGDRVLLTGAERNKVETICRVRAERSDAPVWRMSELRSEVGLQTVIRNQATDEKNNEKVYGKLLPPQQYMYNGRPVGHEETGLIKVQPNRERYVVTSMYLGEDLRRRLYEHCESQGVSVSSFMRKIVEESLKESESEKENKKENKKQFDKPMQNIENCIEDDDLFFDLSGENMNTWAEGNG